MPGDRNRSISQSTPRLELDCIALSVQDAVKAEATVGMRVTAGATDDLCAAREAFVRVVTLMRRCRAAASNRPEARVDHEAASEGPTDIKPCVNGAGQRAAGPPFLIQRRAIGVHEMQSRIIVAAERTRSTYMRHAFRIGRRTAQDHTARRERSEGNRPKARTTRRCGACAVKRRHQAWSSHPPRPLSRTASAPRSARCACAPSTANQALRGAVWS